MKLDELIGQSFRFYGVDGNHFKLDDSVFLALEDESDGYRSYLGSVETVNTGGLIFFREPLDTVTVGYADGTPGNYAFEGYALKAADGHVWLYVGTASADDYYPWFEFRYTPRSPGRGGHGAMSETEGRAFDEAQPRILCELDRQVAEAMGVKPSVEWWVWCPETRGIAFDSHWEDEAEAWRHNHPIGSHGKAYQVVEAHLYRRYSTDPTCVGEMLEWAAAQGSEPYVYCPDGGPWEARFYYGGNRRYGYGSTPQEALARAIVAAGSAQ